MPTPDQMRIQNERLKPRIVELWRALRPLTSVLRFMQSGAHPDDETSAMLAVLGWRDGLSLSYACSTRGEGGQNDIGTERGAELGALRTVEMEAACDVLGLRMYWLSDNPQDPITDFGFSKSGTETLGKWGQDRTLARFVDILRTERPDMLCPTFLDVPGQHGHHRAMTQAAPLAIAAAADPGYAGSSLPPWQVRKLYLPAWSGAGQAYDDDEPPPDATLVIDGTGRDPVTGWSYEHIGQHSRAFHRTQGMGQWRSPGSERSFPLHLAQTTLTGPDKHVSDGLPATLAALADLPGAGVARTPLRTAQKSVDAALAAFPDGPAVAAAAWAALDAVRAARRTCPPELAGEILHRLDDKETQLGHVLRLALGVEAHGRLSQPWMVPGVPMPLSIEARGAEVNPLLAPGWQFRDGHLVADASAAPFDPYRPAYDPERPAAPALRLRIADAGRSVDVALPLEVPPVLQPARSARLSPAGVVLNRATDVRSFEVGLSDLSPEDIRPELHAPKGWSVERSPRGFVVRAPDTVSVGLYRLPLMLDGQPMVSLRRIAHDHVFPTALSHPAELQVRVLETRLPQVRVGYIGAGNDAVADWLGAMGADVTALDDATLADPQALARFDTLVIGIFALRFRPALAPAMERIRRWTSSGGTLVTLYHRPWDNWDPDTTPPYRLEIGQPSLRWRVTDEAAPVTVLEPGHPLLTTPNPIGPDDWSGWDKERGLYFAKAWDRAYVPLLAMNDPGEDPLHGALLAADVGKGRHVHCALILHHQMERLVPGAFRLMANLISRR